MAIFFVLKDFLLVPTFRNTLYLPCRKCIHLWFSGYVDILVLQDILRQILWSSLYVTSHFFNIRNVSFSVNTIKPQQFTLPPLSNLKDNVVPVLF